MVIHHYQQEDCIQFRLWLCQQGYKYTTHSFLNLSGHIVLNGAFPRTLLGSALLAFFHVTIISTENSDVYQIKFGSRLYLQQVDRLEISLQCRT